MEGRCGLIKQVSEIRLFRGLLTCAPILILQIIGTYLPLLQMHRLGFINYMEFTENCITGDYHSALYYEVVNFVVYMFFITYVMREEATYIFCRYNSREQYWGDRIKDVIICTLLFSIQVENVSIIFAIAFCDIQLLLAHGWIHAIIFQIIGTSVYLLSGYLIYVFLCGKIKKQIAMLAVVLIESIRYYIFYIMEKHIGIQVGNFALLRGICIRYYTLSDCWGIIIYTIAINIILFVIILKINSKEDLLCDDK